VVCLGLDVHERQITVVRQVDGLQPQPAQRFTREGLLRWVGRMIAPGAAVHSCYEAGCFGYSLHRELCAAGVNNHVIAPENWCGAAKTDKRDAREMCLRLEGYIRGNRRALCVIRVPSVEEEARREEGRQRERMLKERQRAAHRGGGLLRKAGRPVPAQWWRPGPWAQLSAQLDEGLCLALAVWQQQAVHYEALQAAARQKLAEKGRRGQAGLPAGLGGLTWELLGGEILDWSRFANRRAVASYTGLCPGEHSSGESRRQGGINRHGNRRVRTLLIECVWRLSRLEKGWRGFAKFPQLLDRKASSRARRKGVVAAARLLAIDLWRLGTAQTEARALGFSKGFVPAACPAPAAAPKDAGG
jgi:transposase